MQTRPRNGKQIIPTVRLTVRLAEVSTGRLIRLEEYHNNRSQGIHTPRRMYHPVVALMVLLNMQRGIETNRLQHVTCSQFHRGYIDMQTAHDALVNVIRWRQHTSSGSSKLFYSKPQYWCLDNPFQQSRNTVLVPRNVNSGLWMSHLGQMSPGKREPKLFGKGASLLSYSFLSFLFSVVVLKVACCIAAQTSNCQNLAIQSPLRQSGD